MRKRGYIAEVVEKWIPKVNVRKDFIGIIDILCFSDFEIGCIGIQTTTATNHSTRKKKALAEPRLKIWLLSGQRFIIHSWKGNVLREEELTLKDL